MFDETVDDWVRTRVQWYKRRLIWSIILIINGLKCFTTDRPLRWFVNSARLIVYLVQIHK